MAPSYDLAMSSNGSSPLASRSPSPEALDDDLAALEATYQSSTIVAGPEVEFFAGALDQFNLLRGTPAEKKTQIYKLVDNYWAYSQQRFEHLQERQAKQQWQLSRAGDDGRQGSHDMDVDEVDIRNDKPVDDEEVEEVKQEAQTWDLLRRILPLRYRVANTALKATSESPRRTRQECWNEFLLSDNSTRERKVVLEWLQSSACAGPSIDEIVSELQQSAERGDILAHGWLHTRHKIKLQKSVNAYQGVLDPKDPKLAESHLSSDSLVTQLDPDAMTRQGRKLASQDESFESAIWLGCYEMLRRGYSMQQIREWLAERTESWRAATISMLPLSNPDDDSEPDFDIASAVLWQRMCLKTARDGGTSKYERAVYGLLAGDSQSVEPICYDWDDFLFANYNALLRDRFNSYLVDILGAKAISLTSPFPLSLGVHNSDPNTAEKRVIKSLEADQRTQSEAMTVAKVLQGAILTNDLDRHFYHQGLVLAKQANATEQKSRLIPAASAPAPEREEKYFKLNDHHDLRVLAHLYIIITTLDQLSGFSTADGGWGSFRERHEIQEHVIAGYISYLRLTNLDDLIPLYASKLRGPRIYTSLARNLIEITQPSARMNMLSIMRKLDLDIGAFAKTMPMVYLTDAIEKNVAYPAKGNFNILQDGPPTLKYGRIVKPDFFGDDVDLLDMDEELIIRAMEWTMLVPGLFAETCAYAIRAYKHFLKCQRLRAARAFFTRIPVRRIVAEKAGVLFSGDGNEDNPSWFLEFELSEFSDEFLEECQLDKLGLVTQVRNLWELECLVKALDSMETLASLAQISREESNQPREMWQRASKEIRLAKDCMQPLLKNWLRVVNSVDPDFQTLRETYIPETVLAFISSLHFVGTSLSRDNLLECMDLAAVIAETGSDVAKEFVNCGRMKELVEAFASCSKALAIWTSEKKTSQANTKKLRETGWSRELWSIKQ